MSPSLVLTANYAAGALELPSPFLRSLRATGSNSDVILIANHGSPDVEKHLTELLPSARLWVPIPKQRYRFFRRLANTFPALAAAYARRLRSVWRSTPSRRTDVEFRAAYLLNITCSRYFLARHFLLQNSGSYDHVMLADSRDVLFQRDPFAGLPLGITTGLESILVRDQPANLQWLQHLYGDDPAFPMDDILPQNVICSGVTLGDVTSVGKYLELICAEFMQKLPRMIHTPYLDQGAHNGLLRTGRIPSAHLVPNGSDAIATIGTSDLSEFSFSPAGQLVASNGNLVSVVHQYDRHPKLSVHLLSKLS
jgi:hypothetical protein